MTNRLLLLLGYVLQQWGFIPVFVSTLCVDCILFLYMYFYLANVNLTGKQTNESVPLMDDDSDHEAEAQSGSGAVPSTSAYIGHMVSKVICILSRLLVTILPFCVYVVGNLRRTQYNG